MADVLKSYLVSLGFKVDEPSLRRFETVLDEASKAAINATSGIAKELLKWQTALVGSFAAVSAGILAVVDSVAEADEKYRVFGEQQMLRKERAEAVMRTLEAMHATMADIPLIMADPERAKRFHDIITAIQAGIDARDPNFEANMVKWRALTTQLTILQERIEEIKKQFASDIIVRFGPQIETLLIKFIEWADYIKAHQKEISDWFADTLIPVLKGAYDGVKAMLIEFTNLVALLTQDKSLETTTVNFEKLARAMDKVLKATIALVKMAGRSGAPGDVGDTGNLPASAPHFGWMDKADAWIKGLFTGDPSATSGGTKGTPQAQDAASRAARLAAQVGAKTGVDPRLIFEQWAFETDGFTSDAFKNLNNLGGVKLHGVLQKYGSLEDSAAAYGDQLNRNFSGVKGMHTEQDFTNALKHGRLGSYFGNDDQGNYTAGMQGMGRKFAGTITTNINVNVAQTDASPSEISERVSEIIRSNNRFILSQLQQGAF